MKTKRLIQMFCLAVLIIIAIFLTGQDNVTVPKKVITAKDSAQNAGSVANDKEEKGVKWELWIPVIVALMIGLLGGGGVISLIQHRKRIKDAEEKKIAELSAERIFKTTEEINEETTAETIYGDTLRAELGKIDMLGSPDIESKTVQLSAAFVSLRISETWRSETRF
ncbi:MAG TPA: hypothetical protein VK186_03645, partial [Candidatus Deferrimicrobium sp.]|nr:hypothetical protein [Candidatus Deferrimicrobium sp.]